MDLKHCMKIERSEKKNNMDIFWVAMSCVQLSYLYIESIEQVVDMIQ